MIEPLLITYLAGEYPTELGTDEFPSYPLDQVLNSLDTLARSTNDQVLKSKLLNIGKYKDFVMKQKEYSEMFLSVTYSDRSGGIPGWSEQLGELRVLLESSPLSASTLGLLNCVVRQLLIDGMLNEGEVFTSDTVAYAFTYKHGFLLVEDALGLIRIIEPSGCPRDSYYLVNLPLYTLSQSKRLRVPAIILENCFVGNRKERVYVDCVDKPSIIGSSLNFAAFLHPSKKISVLELLLEKHPLYEVVHYIYGTALVGLNQWERAWTHLLISLSLNPYYPNPIIDISTFPEKIAIKSLKLSKSLTHPNLDNILSKIEEKETRREIIDRMLDDLQIGELDSNGYIDRTIALLKKARR